MAHFGFKRRRSPDPVRQISVTMHDGSKLEGTAILRTRQYKRHFKLDVKLVGPAVQSWPITMS